MRGTTWKIGGLVAWALAVVAIAAVACKSGDRAKGDVSSDVVADRSGDSDMAGALDEAGEELGADDLRVAEVVTDALALLDQLGDSLLDVSATDAVEDQRSEELTPPDNGFSAGPYGYAPKEIAGPFKVNTLSGPFDFQATWSGGADSYLFLFYHPDYDYSKTLWNSSIKDLLKNSPQNVHYFFLSYTSTPLADMEELKVRVDAALADLGTASVWADRLHLVTVMPSSLDNWLGEFVKSKGYFAFGIDRFQRIRETGMLANVTGDGSGEMKYLAQEANYFNFEYDRELAMAAEGAVTVIPLFDAVEFANDGFVEVTLPSAEDMALFDTLSFDLTLGCKGGTDEGCGEWDYLANLYLCSVENPDDCSLEVGRWITAYRRGGRWVTDASSLLAMLKDGGSRRFRLNVSWQSYVTTLTIRLSNQGKGMRPVAWYPLWTGGEFNLTYNPAKLPVTLDIPATTKKAEVFGLITGHGFGADSANCAEFCNHTHHFYVNGTEYKKTHPIAGIGTGCQIQVKDGVVPNQFGTWPFGRGGWCPGLDVKPFVADVTPSVVKGGSNTLTYKALYFGNEYDPKPVENSSGFAARLDVTTYLILWE